MSYELAMRLDELETGQERYEEFLDVRTVYYVNAEATGGFDAGYQQGKLPPLYEHAATLFAGFAAVIF